jgi:hypothetical protein
MRFEIPRKGIIAVALRANRARRQQGTAAGKPQRLLPMTRDTA